MKEEIWKDIKGFEGLYQVSSFGNVRSLERTLNNGNQWKGRLLKQELNHGYKRVLLCKNGKKQHFRVHKLVAMVFVPNPNNYTIVNHIDEDKTHNYYTNLEWCTAKYNSNYGNCKYKIAKKLSKPVLQFTTNGVLVGRYSSLSDVGRKTGYGIGYISQCCNGKYNTAYDYVWRYVDDV